jgi:hypothetical protein
LRQLENKKLSWSQPLQTQQSRDVLDTNLNRAVRALENSQGEDVTLVCLPSLTFEAEHIKDILGISHYEVRCLWEVLNASKEHVKVIFISSRPISDFILDDMLSNLPNPKMARERVQILSVDPDNTLEGIPLVEKALKNEAALNKLKARLHNELAVLRCFVTTPKEKDFAQKLGVPLWGMDPTLNFYHSKSGNHALFEQADIPRADHEREIKSLRSLKTAIKKLWSRWPDAKRFMFKFDHGVSGNGLALMSFEMNYNDFFDLSIGEKNQYLDQLIHTLEFKGKKLSKKDFVSQISRGAVLERFFEGEKKTSPSGQAVIHPDGNVELLSTHEQILAPCGVTYLGCKFPANSQSRREVENYTLEVAKTLSFNGVIGPVSVDFLVVEEKRKEPSIYAIEINIRQGGTTHPFQSAKNILAAQYNQETGSLEDPEGDHRIYASYDNLVLNGKNGRDIHVLRRLMQEHGLAYNKQTKSGFIFHMMSALEEFGKCGYTLIARDQRQRISLERKLFKVLQEFSLV